MSALRICEWIISCTAVFNWFSRKESILAIAALLTHIFFALCFQPIVELQINYDKEGKKKEFVNFVSVAAVVCLLILTFFSRNF